MQIGLLQEGETETGTTHAQRYRDMLKEVQLADELGFDFWGTSEQHFLAPVCTVSAPETLYGWIAAHTTHIRLRHMSVLLPFGFNHPLRVAERIATLDLVSNGRAELCTARSNNLEQLERFGTDPKRTRQEWEESMEVIAKSLTLDTWEHHGTLLHDIPPSERVTPTPIQLPHPPLSVVGTSVETHQLAGDKGIGMLSCDSWLGWEHLQKCIDVYREAVAAPATPLTSVVNDTFTVGAVIGHCAPTMDQAKDAARDMALNFFDLNFDILPALAAASPDYYYLEQFQALKEHRGDLEFVMECSPTTLIGDPDYWIERLLRLQAMGVDEVVVRLDGCGHEATMRAIELVGRYVIPGVKTPTSVVRRDLKEGLLWG